MSTETETTERAAVVKERPVLFNAEMVRAILSGAKTQTRRPMKSQPHLWEAKGPGVWSISTGRATWTTNERCAVVTDRKTGKSTDSEYLEPFDSWIMDFRPCNVGDVLWVRETWQTHCDQDGVRANELTPGIPLQYPATYDHWKSKKRNPRFMPRWASRLTLELEAVKVERVAEISNADALAEGCELYSEPIPGDTAVRVYTPRMEFERRWCELHGVESWERNDWVWCLTFKVVTPLTPLPARRETHTR